MSTLEKAILLAANAHMGQTDKVGDPYILHPLRVMMKQKSPVARTVAVLHDVVEDSEQTLDDLRAAGFSEEVCAAVDCLTRRDDESYDEMITRILSNPLAQEVKLADLEDNIELRRWLPDDADKKERLERYHKAQARILAVR